MRRGVVFIVLLALVCFASPPVAAQEEKEETGHLYDMSTYKVPFDELKRVLELWEEMWKPVYTKNQHVLSFRAFTHQWGSDWAILLVVEYESLSAMEAAQSRAQEIRKEMFADDKWQAAVNEVQEESAGHTDDIVKEVPSLRK